MLGFVAPRQFEVIVRRFLRLLDEAVQQDHAVFLVDVEKNPGDAIVSQVGPYFIDAAAQWPADGHSNRPAELYCFDVLADPPSIISQWQSLEPSSHGFAAGRGTKEDDGNAFAFPFERSMVDAYGRGRSGLLAHLLSVPHKVQVRNSRLIELSGKHASEGGFGARLQLPVLRERDVISFVGAYYRRRFVPAHSGV